jgi:glycine/sarcosine N-methyltransferase
MSIYEDLAPIYDDLFPQNPAATAFLLGLARQKSGAQGLPRRVLDIGCATASQLLELAASGWEAFGIEPSRSMRERAQAMARRSGLSLQVSDGSMLDARGRFPKGHFGLLLCIGNTLPYLGNEEELREFLGGAAYLLAPGGTLVLQTLNYARVLASFGGVQDGRAEGFAFPELHAGRAVFRRRYEEAQGGRLSFITEVFQEGKEIAREASLLTPFRPETLVESLQESGFEEPRALRLGARGLRFLKRDRFLPHPLGPEASVRIIRHKKEATHPLAGSLAGSRLEKLSGFRPGVWRWRTQFPRRRGRNISYCRARSNSS